MMKHTNWLVWFSGLAILAYLPINFPFTMFGVPSRLTYWLFLTAIMLASILIFAMVTWEDWK